MSFVDWFMASFLYCFPYSCRSFTLLKALTKSNSNLFAIAFKSENHQKRSKELIQKTDAKRIKGHNFTRGNREKLNIANAILEI